MDTDLDRIGSKIRELRLNQGLSQEDLAIRADIHRTYIGGVERGERNLGVRNLIAIARALDVHPSVLLLGVTVITEAYGAARSNHEISKQKP